MIVIDGTAMREHLKFVVVHLLSAVIVGAIGYLIFTHGFKFAKTFLSPDAAEYLQEYHIDFIVLILLGFLTYYVVRIPDDFLRYIWFRFVGEERHACGLYIEAYFTEKKGKSIPVVSFIVVYFDVRAEQLKIGGHAYVQVGEGTSLFKRHASWKSQALFFQPKMNDFDVFYIHEGDLADGENGLRGTTMFNLPSSDDDRKGYFCDLVEVEMNGANALQKEGATTHFGATHFDIIRAPDQLEGIFRDKISGWFEKVCYRLKLSCPKQQAFRDFLNFTGRDLIKDCGDTTMKRVWSELKA